MAHWKKRSRTMATGTFLGPLGGLSGMVLHDPCRLTQFCHRNLRCRTLVSGEELRYAVAVGSRTQFFFSNQGRQLRYTEDFSVGGDGGGNVRVAADYTGQSYKQLYNGTTCT